MSAIRACRMCGGEGLDEVLSLGSLALSGIFPHDSPESVPNAPLDLVRCAQPGGCGLIQLRHSYSPSEMYGPSYGYRSGLNSSMIEHLRHRIESAIDASSLEPGDLVLDIGSNDGTSLSFYPERVTRVGIDPTARQFRDFYDPSITVVEDFFSADRVRHEIGERPFSIITSFSMFYDVEDPLAFARDVASLLREGGLWIFEQSYLPTMLANNAYDTICHEHLAYYSLGPLVWMSERAGLEIVDVDFDATNGGSFCVTAQKRSSACTGNTAGPIVDILAREHAIGLDTDVPYAAFRHRIQRHKHELSRLLHDLVESGRRVAGLGASTKGNILLQYCEIGPQLVEAIGEVNLDKIGAHTPGSLIPIRREEAILDGGYDVLLILPWHFADTFRQKTVRRPAELLLPLPEITREAMRMKK